MLQAALAVLLVLLILAYGHVAGKGAQTMENALAGVFGAVLGMLGTMISRRSATRSGQAAMRAPQYAMVPVYLGLLNKLLVVGGGLAIGMVALGFDPIYIVSGYLVSQFALVWVAVRRT